MAKKREFDGIPFAPKTKCIGCEHLDNCRNRDQSATIKCILLECESFYYVFKKLEGFEKRPFFDGNTAKYTEAILAYEKKHEGFRASFFRKDVVFGIPLEASLLPYGRFLKNKGCYQSQWNWQWR